MASKSLFLLLDPVLDLELLNEITLDSLRQLLHIQTELRDQAESKWRKAQRALLGLLETFAPEEVDQRLKTGQVVDSLPVDELELLIRQSVAARLNRPRLSANENQAAKGFQDLQEQMAILQGELKEAQAQNIDLTERIKALEFEKSGLQSQLAALQQVSRKNPTGPEIRTAGSSEIFKPDQEPTTQPEPEWMEKWRQAETFERDAGILKMIGEAGLARRPLIEAQSAERLGIKKAGGSIHGLLARLVELNLIEFYRPWGGEGAGAGGRFPDLARLTDRGRLAFWLLSGNQPAINEYELLLKRHVSPEHTLLNLQVADILREAGYQVNLTPPDITLPDGGLFKPDLVLVDREGVTLFVEVERDTDKNVEQRQSKWRNFHQASGGRLFVVSDNRSGMRNIRSEINYCLGNQPGTISLTNLAELLAGKRGEGESIWLEVKQNRN